MKDFPKSMVIVGAGVIGCEYATIFSNFGKTKVYLMYYFRAIPDFKLIKYFLSNLFLKGDHQVDHLKHIDYSPFLFSYSRDAMNILINVKNKFEK